jgi:hypothetical protein
MQISLVEPGLTVIKITPFNNIIGIENYVKKVTLKNVHCPSGKI